MVQLPTLVLARRARQVGSDWTEARSWLGGPPRLGPVPWPRAGKDRVPMYFLAQIDLAEIARHLPLAYLPDKGSLAFFIAGEDSETCAVVHVPPTALLQHTEPPKDTPPAIEIGGSIFPQSPGPRIRKLFPYWPVEIAPIEVSDQARQQDVNAAVGRIFERRRHFFNAREAYALLGEAPRPSWWHSAIYYADCLMNALHYAPARMKVNQSSLDYARRELDRLGPDSNALDKARKNAARLEAERDLLRATLPKFTAFAKKVSSWIEGNHSADRMQPEESDRFNAIFERGRSEFRDFTCYRTPLTSTNSTRRPCWP